MFARKLDQEKSASIGLILDRDGALVLFDNAIGNRETKACSCTNFLCREKWIKDTLFKACRYTGPGITKSNLHHIGLECTDNGNDFTRRINHCIACVGQ